MKKTCKIQGLIRTTAELFIIIILLFSILSPIMNSWIVEPGYRYNIENEIYQVDAPMNFSRVTIASSDRFEYWMNNTIPIGSYGVYGSYRVGQTFTVGNVGENIQFRLRNLSFFAYRVGSPGMCSVDLYATSGGKPTGSSLATTSFNGNSLTTNTLGELVNVYLSPEYMLLPSTQYVFVLHAPDGSSGVNEVRIRDLAGASHYTGGSLVCGGNPTWSIQNSDAYFDTYGTGYVVFNNTGFNITAPSNILITLRNINDSTVNAVENDELLEFKVYMVSGTTTISISGFRENTIHNIYKDSILDTIFLSNSTGCIEITIDSGISYIYTVYRGGNTAPVISSPSPGDGATGIGFSPTLSASISDAEGNLMDWYIRTNDSGSWLTLASNIGVGNTSISTSTTGSFVNYSTLCTWSVNCTDGTSWTNQTFTFTTLANTAPTISSPSPGDGVSGVSVSLASLSVTISDSEDTFNWTITTSPNIGSSGANGESNGVKTCAIAGLNYDGFYTWTVSVTDGTSWTNQTFDFTVESDPGGGPPPNSAPTTSNPYPADEATLVHLMPICHVVVTDANLDSIDVNFYWLNETSVWNLSQTNSSVSSGSTVYWNYTNATEYETTYGWKVTADDGIINISHNYSFTTWTNTPQVVWTYPTDGTVDIPLSGVTVNAELFDYQGDKMNVSIWSNYTGSWVEYAGRAVWVVGENDKAFILDYNDDGSWNFQDMGLWHINNGWGGNGTWGFYLDMVVTDNWGMDSYSTTYLISINISDNSTDRAWNNYTFSFTTEINTAPTISGPIPRDGVRWVSVYTDSLSVEISDANSNFNYSIETDPDIGTISENNVGDGVKTCTVSGLNFSTTYTWYVNATDGSDWDNKSYTFTTKGETDFDIEGFKLNLPEWAMGPYKVYVGDFIWMFLFVGVIAISWGSSKHISTVFIVILLTFAAYGTQRVFVDNSEISLLFSVIAAVCIAAIMLGLFLRKKYG